MHYVANETALRRNSYFRLINDDHLLGESMMKKFFVSAAVVTSIANIAYADDVKSVVESDGGSWLTMVGGTQEAQPHWITPLVTVTPRLEQEFRYDQIRQYSTGGVSKTFNGAGKGLELIPTENTEVIVGVPNYLTKDTPKTSTGGWQDETFLAKYRLLSANEEHGNYIVTGFMGISVPTGDSNLTAQHTVFTPALSAGKGWGTREAGVDIQSTFAYSISSGDRSQIDIPSAAWNTAVQAHVFKYFWPEIEANYTRFKQGPDAGRNQLVMTYGVILGRIPIQGRTNLIVGVGYQEPSGSSFSTYNHGWNLSSRLTF